MMNGGARALLNGLMLQKLKNIFMSIISREFLLTWASMICVFQRRVRRRLSLREMPESKVFAIGITGLMKIISFWSVLSMKSLKAEGLIFSFALPGQMKAGMRNFGIKM